MFRPLILITGITCIILSVLAGLAVVMAGGFREPVSEDQAIVYSPIVPELNTPRPDQSFLDVQYCDTLDKRQALDIFTPQSQPNQLAPALIYIHGGGWSHSHKRSGFLDYYKGKLLEQGVAVVAVNHRLAPEHVYPAQNNDVACAIEFVHRHAARFGIDRQQLALFGESSGAQLITSVALDPANNQAPWKKALQAVIPFYGISNFELLLDDPNYRGLARVYLAPEPYAVAKQASALGHPIQQPPDFFIYHGDRDSVIPYSQSALLHNYLIENGGHSSLILVKDGGHGFTMRSTPNVEQIRQMMLQNLHRSFHQSGILN